MNNYIQGVEGSDSVLTTYEAETEVIQKLNVEDTRNPSYYKFHFYNRDTCTVSINNQKPILLYQGQNFSTERGDMVVESFKIIEPNVRYHWVGYR